MSKRLEWPCARKGCRRKATPAEFTVDVEYGGFVVEIHLCTPCGLQLVDSTRPVLTMGSRKEVTPPK